MMGRPVRHIVEPNEDYGRLLTMFPKGKLKSIVNRLVKSRNGREVVRPVEMNKTRLWYCYCNPEKEGCGNVAVVREDLLLSGETQSCGCLKFNTSKRRGGKESPTVTVMGKKMTMKAAMKLCQVTYSEYLKRRHEGWSFQKAILTPPNKHRRQYQGSYEVNGEMMTLSAAVRKYGKVSRQTVYARLDSGWDLMDALTTESRDK